MNKPLDVDETINLPLTLSYKTDIPPDFLRFFPQRLKNYILYGSMISPTQTIALEVQNILEGVETSIETNEIKTEIPFQDSPISISNSLNIELKEILPAEPYTISIKASSGQIGRINSFSTEMDVSFTPRYIASATLDSLEETSLTLSYNNDTRFSFNIRNDANKKSKIFPYVEDIPENLFISFYPESQEVNMDETTSFTISLLAESGFKENKTIAISATFQPIPLDDEDTAFEIDQYISLMLEAPPQPEGEFSFNPHLILNIILIAIIVLLLLFGKRKQCW